MAKTHVYNTQLQWTGNKGNGTSGYTAYERSHSITADNKPVILASSDPAFRGDAGRYNPEELLVASLSSCHMLWFLHLCADAGIVVIAYEDAATGCMLEDEAGGRFTGVTLRPTVIVKEEDMVAATAMLHQHAHQKCFIANSCNFPVKHEPVCFVRDTV